MNYGFEDYENAVLAALDDLRIENGGYLKALRGYAGDLASPTAAIQFYGKFPGVLVEVTQAIYDQHRPAAKEIIKQVVTVTLYVGSKNWRGQTAARTGDEGVYQILSDIRGLLHGKTLGLVDVPPWACEVAREVKHSGDLTGVVYLAQYTITNLIIHEV